MPGECVGYVRHHHGLAYFVQLYSSYPDALELLLTSSIFSICR